mmetsp:Transcript_22055/g.63275  ORF Transcript_22055/g.63275 Transcript_22055/m.63275 type:complete len:251 (+) Transcript_22055:344-1096(+)
MGMGRLQPGLRQRLPGRVADVAGHVAAAASCGDVAVPAVAFLRGERLGACDLRQLEVVAGAHRWRAVLQALPGQHVERDTALGARRAPELALFEDCLRLLRQRAVPYTRGREAHVARQPACPHGAHNVDDRRRRASHDAGVLADVLQGVARADGILGTSGHASRGARGCGAPHRSEERERRDARDVRHEERGAADPPLVSLEGGGGFLGDRPGHGACRLRRAEGPAHLSLDRGQRTFWCHRQGAGFSLSH